VDWLLKTLPEDVSIDLIFTRADDIRESYQASIEDLVLGCALAVIVVGLFLRDWRSTIITSLALPLSMIPTFLVLRWFGYTLNSMTLLALTLAVGNLVDDAIVEIENVERHSRMGQVFLPGYPGLHRRGGAGGAGLHRHHCGGVPAGGLHGGIPADFSSPLALPWPPPPCFHPGGPAGNPNHGGLLVKAQARRG
jgi:hypothetical protein